MNGPGLMPQSIFRPNAGLTGLPGGGPAAPPASRVIKQPRWVIAGQFVTFEEFTQELFPDDTPGRTRFLLKYTGDQE